MKFYKYAAIVLVMAMRLAVVEGSSNADLDDSASRYSVTSTLTAADAQVLGELNTHAKALKKARVLLIRCSELADENARLRDVEEDDLLSSQRSPRGNRGGQSVGSVDGHDDEQPANDCFFRGSLRSYFTVAALSAAAGGFLMWVCKRKSSGQSA